MQTVLCQRWPIAADLATGAFIAFDHYCLHPSAIAGAGGSGGFSSASGQATHIELGLQPAPRLADEYRCWPASWRQSDGDDILH